jgi:hypothetical protein
MSLMHSGWRLGVSKVNAFFFLEQIDERFLVVS